MSRTAWIGLAILGAVLVVLVTSGDSGTLMGLQPWQLAAIAVNIVLALWIFGGAFGGLPLSNALRNFALWALIIATLMGGYVFRYELQDMASTFSGGLLPGSPINRAGDDGRQTVTLVRSRSGHFEADVIINGTEVRFLVDTGATGIVLPAREAQRIGFDLNSLQYTQPSMTANGIAYSARERIELLEIGGIRRRNMPITISQPGRLSTALLGQTFLESLSSYERRGDRLTLRD
ncbi:MAG: TIGR02281 family clan AA aspartic protease [Pseudomonadota bacterium]